jgi:hypothetical protein
MRLKPIRHGEDAGYQAHRRRGERACLACMDAHTAYQQKVRARRQPKPPRELIACGSPAAWRRHKRNGEEPCGPCADAHRDEVNHYARKRRAA